MDDVTNRTTHARLGDLSSCDNSSSHASPFYNLWSSYLNSVHMETMRLLELELAPRPQSPSSSSPSQPFKGRVLLLDLYMMNGWGNRLPSLATAAIIAVLTKRWATGSRVEIDGMPCIITYVNSDGKPPE